MKITRIITVFALLLITCTGAFAMTLAKDGKAAYTIVTLSSATAPEVNAAKELQKYLSEVTGASFEVKREAEVKATTPQILVGQSEKVKRLLPDVDWKSLGQDGIVIRTVGDTLVLAGGRPRGSLYAVYTFLEDTVGCRWWTSTENFIPKKPTLTIGKLSVNYTPKFRSREAYYKDVLDNPLFAAKLRLNGHMHAVPDEYGSHYQILGWCHTSFSLLPPDKYAKDHPDWYGNGQLCWSNVEMQKELAKNAIEWIKRAPNAGIISISQNDSYVHCECEKCKKIDEEEGSPSGSLIRGINAVAEEIEKQYPDFLVETLAYVYSRKPPLHVKPRRNVLIRLCSIEGWFNEPLNNDINKPFRDDMQGWAAIAPNLFVWDYVTNFCSYILPHPNLHTLGANLRFFQENKAIGVFEQGDAQTTIGDFVRLRGWLIGHLLWNPYQDEKKLTQEFLNGYYGPAAPYISQYLAQIQTAVLRQSERIGCGNLRTNYLTFDDITKMTELFAQAEKVVASDPVLAKRVRRDRMPLDHVWLQRYPELKEAAAKENKPFLGPKDPVQACEEFISLSNEWHNGSYSEVQGFDTYSTELRFRFVDIPKAEELVKPAEGAIDLQEDQFTLDDPGKRAKNVDDPAASNGKTAYMPGDRWECFVHCNLPKGIAAAHPGKHKMYIVARADIKMEDANPAFRYGLGSNAANLNVVISKTNHDMVDGKYKTCYVGSYELKDDMSFWLQAWPSGNVNAFYVDHIVLVPDK